MSQTRLMNIYQVATLFNVSRQTIRRWWAEGKIPAPIKIGRSLRWRESDIDAFIKEQERYECVPQEELHAGN